MRALVGFTRLSAPERDDLQPVRRVSLTRGNTEWVPAVEQRGEGIFLQLREDMVAGWASAVAGHEHIERLRSAYRQWALDREQTQHVGFPIARFTLMHTLSHMLIRQVALECGYSSASLRERIYLGTPEAPTAGVLLSTAASDSEGTLGGLRFVRNRMGYYIDQSEFIEPQPGPSGSADGCITAWSWRS